jgi:mutator protein MutT
MEGIEIAAAIVFDEAGRVLIARRRSGAHLAGRCEFPGGKLQPGETAEEACRRECREEIGIDVAVLGRAAPRLVHRYPDRTVALSFFRCALAAGSPEPRAIEVDDVQWMEPARLPGLRWPEANREIVARIAAGEITRDAASVRPTRARERSGGRSSPP